METAVSVASLLFLLLLFTSYQKGAGGFGPYGTQETSENNESEVPRALETSFERWYRSEEDQLLASFFLFNHSEEKVAQVEILCATFQADGTELENYRRIIQVDLLPGQVRHLAKTRIGKLDPLAQRAVCRIDSWK
jgi:hypothetical protein